MIEEALGSRQVFDYLDSRDQTELAIAKRKTFVVEIPFQKIHCFRRGKMRLAA
jgi:hypothetical protein